MRLVLVDKPTEVLVEEQCLNRAYSHMRRHDTCQEGRHAEILPHVSNLIRGKRAKPALQNIQFQ